MHGEKPVLNPPRCAMFSSRMFLRDKPPARSACNITRLIALSNLARKSPAPRGQISVDNKRGGFHREHARVTVTNFSQSCQISAAARRVFPDARLTRFKSVLVRAAFLPDQVSLYSPVPFCCATLSSVSCELHRTRLRVYAATVRVTVRVLSN